MSTNEQIPKSPAESGKPLSLAERLATLKSVVSAAKMTVQEEKTAGAREKKKAAEITATSAKERAQVYENLSKDSVDYDAVKNLTFEPFFKTLGGLLRKSGQMPEDFDKKNQEIIAVKKEIANMDSQGEEIINRPEVAQIIAELKAEVVTQSREWSKILSE